MISAEVFVRLAAVSATPSGMQYATLGSNDELPGAKSVDRELVLAEPIATRRGGEVDIRKNHGSYRRGSHAAEAVLVAMDRFMRLEMKGCSPDVGEFLTRYPRHADQLRPLLEGAKVLRLELLRFKQRNRGIDIARLLGFPPSL